MTPVLCIDTCMDTVQTVDMTTNRTFTTDADIRDDVDQSLQGAPGYPADYDIDGIVSEIVQTVGIDGYAEMEETEFYAIVARHDSTQA